MAPTTILDESEAEWGKTSTPQPGLGCHFPNCSTMFLPSTDRRSRLPLLQRCTKHRQSLQFRSVGTLREQRDSLWNPGDN